MPLHIDIRVNRELINTLHIARVKGGTDPDEINDYLILDGPEPLRHEDWLIDGIPFQHRYGDGAEVCVMKGIRAMQGNPLVTNEDVTDELQNERMRIWEGIETLYINSEKTRTPIYQDTMYDYMRKLVWATHPPVQFRDTANGE